MRVFLKILPYFILIAGAILMVIGIVTGDATQVMRQAITICLECVGIG